MSNQSHLPPRCPNPRTSCPVSDNSCSILCKDETTHPLHHQSVSQSLELKEHPAPAWLDDLFDDWGQSCAQKCVATDSGTVLDEFVELPILNMNRSSHSSEDFTTDAVLDSACIYGPNSPRSKEKLLFQDSPIASILSEYASKGTLQYVNSGTSVSGFLQFDSVQDAHGSAGEVNMEAKPLKMHSSQLSRVRKVQYISELEKTVENFQDVVSELAIRVDSVIDQHGYLSMENKQLKQQLALMQQEKLFMYGEYQSMRNEVECLKLGLPLSHRHGDRKVRSHFRSYSDGATEKLCIDPTWRMLDIGNLHIN